MTSAVLIVPADMLEPANALGEAMGWGPNNYSVQLSAAATLPATHYGCRAEVTQTFIDMIKTPPEDNPEAAYVISKLLYDFSESEDGHDHFTRVITEHNLNRIKNNGTEETI